MFQQNNTNFNKRKIAAIIAVIAILLTAIVIFLYDSAQKTNEHFGYAMGSEITAVFYGRNKQDIVNTVFSRITVLDVDYISRKSEYSEIYRLNKNGTLKLSEKTLSYLKQALEICKSSDGAFDITIGGLSSLWDFDSSKNEVPGHSEIENLLSLGGYEKIKINEKTVTLGKNQILDFGALGKGLACDIAKEVLDESNTNRALITVGGTVMTYEKSTHKGWDIGIRTPDADNSEAFMKVHLTGTNFISTSGNYEKYFEADGKIYHHILDPKTGYPAESGLKSVTIIAENGLVSDALSTACFVLGRENSESLLEKYNAQAIFVDNENNVYITDGIIDFCTILNDSYRISSYE